LRESPRTFGLDGGHNGCADWPVTLLKVTGTILEIDGRPDGGGLAAQVMALGRQGWARTEIAAALGLEMAELAAREAGDADVARALRLAAEAERAWWEGQPREALTAGARLDFGAWREAMRWRFGAVQAAADAAAGTAARGEAEAAAQPARPLAKYYIPDNLRERRLPDGTPITPEMRRERAIAQAEPFLAAAERRMARAEEALAKAQEELEEWREEMRHVEARNYDPDAEEDDDEDQDDRDDQDDWDEENESDDDDEGDERDGEADDADGDNADGGDRDGDAGDSLPLAPGGESPPPAFSGGDEGGDDGGRLSAGAAGCEWAVPAGVAGPPAWAAQPHFGAGDAPSAEGLRDRLR
jgi:hypothetical protein